MECLFLENAGRLSSHPAFFAISALLIIALFDCNGKDGLMVVVGVVLNGSLDNPSHQRGAKVCHIDD